jgi:hypothetical protein
MSSQIMQDGDPVGTMTPAMQTEYPLGKTMQVEYPMGTLTPQFMQVEYPLKKTDLW